MCYYTEVDYQEKRFRNHFKTKVGTDKFAELGLVIYNGFSLPEVPAIYGDAREVMDVGRWGLKPFWAKDDKIAMKTLNARIETIEEKPAFRASAKNRCLLPVTAFFEWKWLDENGKKKEKYRIHTEGKDPFALGGIWAEDKDGNRTVSIVTTEANELMAEIHNTKKRMPVVLNADEYDYWLQEGAFEDFKDRTNIELIADIVNA